MPLNLFRASEPIGRAIPSLSRAIQKARWRAILPALAVSLVAFMGISSVVGFVLSTNDQTQLLDFRAVTREVKHWSTPRPGYAGSY
jgi:hypothetical protein